VVNFNRADGAGTKDVIATNTEEVEVVDSFQAFPRLATNADNEQDVFTAVGDKNDDSFTMYHLDP
jgi:hypothetical protein